MPIPYICRKQLTEYNHGVIEPDGDSLYYYLVSPLTAAGSAIPFSAGYYKDTPVSVCDTFKVNATTGQLSFTPDIVQNSVVALKCEEYRAGILIGHTTRELQVVVEECTNAIPTLTLPTKIGSLPR